MKQSVLLTAAVAALALAGCKKTDSPAADVTASDTPAADVAAPAPASSTVAANPDQAFADAAAASDAFEIQSSQLAIDKGQTGKTREFAQAMIKAHTGSTAKLKTAAANATPAITPLPQLMPEQQRTLSSLSQKSGAEFAAAYAQAQVDAHQMTLDKLKAYAATGGQASLKSFATGLIPTVTAHLNMAKALS